MNEIRRKELKETIEEIRSRIKDFADKDLYSVNCPDVKYLYTVLRKLEAELEEVEYVEPEEEYYEPIFIGDSDVPIDGRYE